MAGVAPIVVESKLAPPPVAARAVQRDRLFDDIDDGARLLAVVAPAGSGKTTACAQLALRRAAAGYGIAWVSLDRGDQDPARFWAHLEAALCRADVPLAASLVPGDGLVAEVANALSTYYQRLTIVLDDYQTVRSSAVDEMVSAMIDTLPSGVQVVVASRVDPLLPTARLRVRGELAELRAHDLSFSHAEVRALFRRTLDLVLSDAQADMLHARTEGWVAALWVAALGMRQADDPDEFVATFAGDHAHLVDYLTAEVLDHQPDEVRQFLLRTSILDELCVDVCDAVTGTSGSGPMLERIERAGLFLIPLDTRRRAYRYHQLFADLLQGQLRRLLPDQVADLHSRAARWYATSGDPACAIWHYIEAGAYPQAQELINEWWIPYANRGRSATVWSWFDAVPSERRALDPMLCVQIGWARLNQGRYEELDDVLPADARDTPLILAHRYRHQGDVGRATQSAAVAVSQLTGRPDVLEAAAHAAIGVTLYWAGDHDAAPAHLRTAAEIGPRHGDISAAVSAYGYLALLSTGDEAETHARAALALCATPDEEAFHAPVAALLALARAALDQRRLDAADQTLAKAEAIAAASNEPLAHAVCSAWQGELAHLRGDTARGRAHLRDAERALTRLPGPGHATELIRTVAAALRFAPRQLDPGDRPTPPLTERELTVLRLLPGTITRRQLANELHISLATIKTHMHAIARKLGVSTRAQIVERARELGLLP